MANDAGRVVSILVSESNRGKAGAGKVWRLGGGPIRDGYRVSGIT